MDFDNMTDEEIVRGLMRGERPSFKMGYSPAAAISAMESLGRCDDNNRAELLAYARGFNHGMHEDASMTNPTVES